MNPLDAVRRFFAEQEIRDVAVTAALSGGADSVCLLYCLLAVRETYGLEIAAVHVQHQLRGEESIRDEAFCRRLCETLSVPLTVIPVDVKARQMQDGSSEETAARDLRYAVFAEIPGYTATAHTADDQLETQLLRLARGTGLKGLCGIPGVRERYLRPLLSVTRAEIEAYLREIGADYVTDSTNLTDRYARNALRHHAVPVLKAVNPAAAVHAAQTAELLRLDETLLERLTAETYARLRQADGSLKGLSAVQPALQLRCIAQFLEENGYSVSRAQIFAVAHLLETGGSAELVRGMPRVCVSRDVLFLRQQPGEIPYCLLKLGKNQIFPDYFVEAELILRKNVKKFSSVYTMFTDSVLDHDIIKGYAGLHGRVPGLRIQPAGREHHVTVKKWLQEQVPPEKRAAVHFLSDAEGLLWVEGLGAAARAAVTEQTQRMLLLTVHRTDT